MPDMFNLKNITPMLLQSENEPFDSDDYIYELKFDGARCLAYIGEYDTVLRNKRNKDVTAIYPELSMLHFQSRKKCIIDGELVAFRNGKPDFRRLMERSLNGNKFKIQLAAELNPVDFVAFDILYLDGEDITHLPLSERKKLLEQNITEGLNLSISRYIERTGIYFFNLAKERELEGIVAKRKDSPYKVGKRTGYWKKIKNMQDVDMLVCGYTLNEKNEFKSIILGDYNEDGSLVSRGKVSSGVSPADKEVVLDFAKKHTVKKPFDFPENTEPSVYIKPELVARTHFMDISDKGHIRHPVFKGLRPD